jgi:type II secretory pathway component PulM
MSFATTLAKPARQFQQGLATLFDPLRARWQQLDPRARPLIAVMTVLLVVGILWAYVYAPIQDSRVRNAERIAALQSQLATMRAQAEEVRALNAIPPAASTNRAALADAASLTAVFGPAFTVRNEAGQFRIEAARVRYVDWLAKTDEATQRFRVSVASVQIKRLPAAATSADEVSVSITLSQR